jgi:hypothetical protein
MLLMKPWQISLTNLSSGGKRLFLRHWRSIARTGMAERSEATALWRRAVVLSCLALTGVASLDSSYRANPLPSEARVNETR